MLLLNAQDVRQALPMEAAIEAMRAAFVALAEERVQMPLRSQLEVAAHAGLSLIMPAAITGTGEALAVKVVSLFDRNPEHGLARIQGAVLAMDPSNGTPLALLDGAALTAIRTGATSGLATDLLARSDAHTVAVFGAGVQGRTQLEAMCCVREVCTVLVCDPNAVAAQQMVEEMKGRGRIPVDIQAVDADTAAARADVLCTATVSPTPVFADQELKPGCHVNAIGSFQPEVQEIPAATVARARVFVDNRQAALAESGDLIQPLRAGLITADHVAAEIGQLLIEHCVGRTTPEEITLFKSVGLAVQDAAAASAAVTRAKERHLGLNADF